MTDDMARDLRADLANYEDDLGRTAGFGLAFGVPAGANCYAHDVYELAQFATDALPAAIRRALAAEAEAARLRGALQEIVDTRGLWGQDAAGALRDVAAQALEGGR